MTDTKIEVQPRFFASAMEGRDNGLPRITVTARQLPDVTEEALQALIKSNDPPHLFQRAGETVRVREDEDGNPKIEILGQSALTGELARSAQYFRQTGSYLVATRPPVYVAADINSLPENRLPSLLGLTRAPVLRPDGSILDRPGYDPPTKLFYKAAARLIVPPISQFPSPQEIADAIALLSEPICDFPFVNQASRANALALIITPIMRPAIRGCVPLALNDAPQPGSGKGLLADVASIIATGECVSISTAPSTEDEWRKWITSELRDGAELISIDNIRGRLDSDQLAAVFTAQVWKGRVLGKSEMVEIPQLATWIATGNNIRLGGDLHRRCYWIRLDAESAMPFERTDFRYPKLREWVKENRGRLIHAVLTLCRGWFAAGSPKGPTLGSFESWSEMTGGVLAFAGIEGFLGNSRELYESADEEGEEWGLFYGAAKDHYGNRPFLVADLVSLLDQNPTLAASLPEKLAEVFHDPQLRPNLSRKIGNEFSARQERRYGKEQYHVKRAGQVQRAVLWRIATVEQQAA